jgi:hypothetical protein
MEAEAQHAGMTSVETELAQARHRIQESFTGVRLTI